MYKRYEVNGFIADMIYNTTIPDEDSPDEVFDDFREHYRLEGTVIGEHYFIFVLNTILSTTKLTKDKVLAILLGDNGKRVLTLVNKDFAYSNHIFANIPLYQTYTPRQPNTYEILACFYDVYIHTNYLTINGNNQSIDIDIVTCPECLNRISIELANPFSGCCYFCSLKLDNKCVFCEEKATNLWSVDSVTIPIHTGCLNSLIQKPLKSCKICKVSPVKKSEEICKKCEHKIIKEWSYKPVPVFYSTEYKDNNRYLGIELEVEIKPSVKELVSRKDVAYRLDNWVNSGENKFIYFKNDSSIGSSRISDRYFGGFEIVTHPATFEYWKSEGPSSFWSALSKTAKIAQSYPSGNCGMHIHVSKDGFESKLHQAAFGWFIENRLYLTALVSERPSNKHFSVVGKNNWFYVVNSANYISEDHHSMVSFTDKTLEVRCFRGNMKKERILKNIEFVDALAEWTLQEINNGNITGVAKFKLLTSKEFLNYIDKNKEKYCNLHKYVMPNIQKIFMETPPGPDKVFTNIDPSHISMMIDVMFSAGKAADGIEILRKHLYEKDMSFHLHKFLKMFADASYPEENLVVPINNITCIIMNNNSNFTPRDGSYYHTNALETYTFFNEFEKIKNLICSLRKE